MKACNPCHLRGDAPTLEESLTPREYGGDAIFSLENIVFSYNSGQARILDGINLALFPGQHFGLYGKNGSGKTTLFRCITGLNKALDGHVRLRGKILRKEKDFIELRRKVGLVLQDAEDQLFFPSVLEDVAFGPLNMGMTVEKARFTALSSLELVGLYGFEYRQTRKLSGGEKKLVALAAIIAMQPDAMLLDEPLNGLDHNAQARIIHLLQKLECAKIIVSHDHDFLKNTCDGIMLLENGKLSPHRCSR